MLLDEKKTKRRVRIIAVITALAFVGTIIPVIVVVGFQGGGPSPVEEALKVTREEPQNPEAFDDLAAAYISGENVSRADQELAITAARKALSLTPRTATADRLERVQVLSQYYSEAGKADEAFAVVNDYTKQNPKDAGGFLALGTLAADQGKTQLARIALQKNLELDPTGPNADAVRQRLASLPTASAPSTGAGSGAIPVTP